ncbi:hypothetical protein GA0070216_10249 [Micromonospora matsumotoense]|uniref:Uncharacterized protein n=1 Tax=Micromonospora matsumotoense TaxID=121616 RepID=A0A1C4V116_9ACTN|nr:hypothetical protein [Micromonospora matsumotoense]SCE77750.1 hypothetical protein GA0070216_10249 [Micromonospora matsumotoense]
MPPEEKPIRVPVNIDAWRWPKWVDRAECGECGEALPVERLTALATLADAVGDHAGKCDTC